MLKSFSHFLFLVLLSLLVFNCSKFNKIVKSNDPQLKYDAAMKYYEEKDYYKAGILFEELVPIMRGKKEAETIEFFLAFCNFHQKNYVLSAENFRSFYETYGRSERVEEALYMYAMSLYQDSPHYNLDQANTIEAINVGQSFINRYPDSDYAVKANSILIELRHKLEKKDYENAKMYHKVQNWKSAIIAFDNFQKNFPDSPYNEEVAFLEIQSAYIYAKNSIESKQEERYREVVESYERFIDKYGDSKYLKQAEEYYQNSLEEVVKLAKQ